MARRSRSVGKFKSGRSSKTNRPGLGQVNVAGIRHPYSFKGNQIKALRRSIPMTGGVRDDFTPLDLSPVAWWDLQDPVQLQKSGTTESPSPGDTVDTFFDKVGSLDAASVGGDVPFSPSGVDFTASNARYVIAGSASSLRLLHDGSAFGLFIRATLVDDESTQILFSGIQTTADVGLFVRYNSGINRLFIQIYNGALHKSCEIPNPPVGIVDLVVTYNDVYLNGVSHTFTLVSGSPSSADATFNYTIGGNNPTSINNFNANIAQVIILDRAATAEDVAQFATWESPAV